ncbi:hypothetical protein FGG08_001097 [Glutinoglossum americanum]|uniref:HNH nuclease domain-containing protein n=1 Tax=Glutinoglossum americanum TaxID=1670608 RepID=A0A9P8IBU5_9PEZI|nr:hypothetical protein FGG08_001097 [Glutinoglossum americanum]
MEDAPSLTTRDSTLPGKVAKARDRECVITGRSIDYCEVAHIVPYSMGKSQARADIEFWAVLRMFWGNEATKELQDLIFGPPDQGNSNSKTLVNRLYNVMIMWPDAHALWADGCFALEPHPDDDPSDERTQRAVVHWVYPHESSRLEPGVFAPINLTDQLPPLSTILSGDGRWVGLPDGRTNPPTFIQDGHVITFHTDDPIARPLPSRELLRLQYSLIRVLRMAGRAGWDMREMNDSDRDIDSVFADGDRRSRLSGGSARAPGLLANEPLHRDDEGRLAPATDVDRPPRHPASPSTAEPITLANARQRFFRRITKRIKDFAPRIHRKTATKAQ